MYVCVCVFEIGSFTEPELLIWLGWKHSGPSCFHPYFLFLGIRVTDAFLWVLGIQAQVLTPALEALK